MGLQIGMVGLGLMGAAISSNLIKAGFEVFGFDIDAARVNEFRDRGGNTVGNPKEAAEGKSFVVLSLLNTDIVRQVCFGDGGIVFGADQKDLIVLDTTTAKPGDSIEIAGELQKKGIGFLDSTLSGTSKMAWERDLVAMVGGDAKHYEASRPILEAVSRSNYFMGPSGSGARAKLIVNLVLGINRLALAEGLVLGMKSEMDSETLLAVLMDGASYSRAMEDRGERMIQSRYEPPLARIHQHHKDVRLMMEQGQQFGSPLLLTSVLQQVLQGAECAGLKDADTSGIIEVLRSLAGIPSPKP